MRYAAITDRLTGLGSQKWAVHLRARAMAEAGEEIIELTIGEPDLAPAGELLEVCSNAMYSGRTRYARGQGEIGLLDALAAKYSARSGRSIARENVVCLPGTQTALFAAMLTLVDAGQEVIVGDPLYATYEGVIAAAGGLSRLVPLREERGFRMRAVDVAAAVTPATRVVLLNSPHNPTGAVLTQRDVREIGEVCLAHDLWIVCDEVYEAIIFDGEFASPFDDPALADRAVALSSISKSHAAPGFRSGWAVGPAEFCARLTPISEAMLFGSQPFIADMTAHALARPNATAAELTRNYRRRAELFVALLSDAPGVRPLMPQAGMFALLDVSGTGLDGDAFAHRLLEDHRVAVMPGSSFGQTARNYVRISLTVPDDRLAEACRRIAAFADGSAPAAASGSHETA